MHLKIKWRYIGMSDFNEEIRKRYDDLMKQRASMRKEIRLLKKLLENAGALKKVTKHRKQKSG
jgi:hypothetical protein